MWGVGEGVEGRTGQVQCGSTTHCTGRGGVGRGGAGLDNEGKCWEKLACFCSNLYWVVMAGLQPSVLLLDPIYEALSMLVHF